MHPGPNATFKSALFLVAGLLFAATVQAEMYVWRDATGATRMTNVAPPWYSAVERSRPRTRVILNGHVIDDTGLSPERRAQLQAGRARAESWGRGSPASSGASAPVAEQNAARAAAAGPAAAAPPAGVPLAALEGLKRALEAQQLADKLAAELQAANRPR